EIRLVRSDRAMDLMAAEAVKAGIGIGKRVKTKGVDAADAAPVHTAIRTRGNVRAKERVSVAVAREIDRLPIPGAAEKGLERRVICGGKIAAADQQGRAAEGHARAVGTAGAVELADSFVRYWDGVDVGAGGRVLVQIKSVARRAAEGLSAVAYARPHDVVAGQGLRRGGDDQRARTQVGSKNIGHLPQVSAAWAGLDMRQHQAANGR